VLVPVAVDAEVLPVAAVGRVVVAVAVLSVDGQQVEIRAVELARALGADPAVERARARAARAVLKIVVIATICYTAACGTGSEAISAQT